MLQELKERVFKANLDLVKQGLVIYTWGNVSGISDDRKYVVIKPSGVDYDTMTVDDMVVVDLYGNKVEGDLNPSSDTPTHLELYKAYDTIKGVVHTHSLYATSFAQAERDVPAYGTTHADYFYGDIPCARPLSKVEISNNYEKNTGKVIIETLQENKIDPIAIPGINVSHHGPFAFGDSPEKAVYNAKVFEEVCKMAVLTETINKSSKRVDQDLLDKHYLRKHGKNAYYGQKR
jgi:L-ribulose-5-phosphate 4-epimerase